MIRRAWLAAFLLLATPAAAATLTPEQYARALAQVATRLERAEKSSPAARAAEQVLRGLPVRVTVQAGSEAPRLTVDNRELLTSLRKQVKAGPKGIRTAAGIVRSLEQAVTSAASSPPPNARAALNEVLSRREFHPQWWEGPVEKFNRWVGEVLLWLIGKIHLPKLDVNLPENVWRGLGFGLLLLVAAVIIFLIARLMIRAAVRSQVPPAGPMARPLVILPYSAWLAEAEQRLQAGDYRAALRALHMAALMKLDEAGHVRYDSSHTDGRFVRALRSKGLQDLASALARLNHLFAVSWYGRRPAGPSEYAAARTLWAELETAVAP